MDHQVDWQQVVVVVNVKQEHIQQVDQQYVHIVWQVFICNINCCEFEGYYGSTSGLSTSSCSGECGGGSNSEYKSYYSYSGSTTCSLCPGGNYFI